jgi:hypothetical protein
MKPTTRLIALVWLVVGASIWWTALQGGSAPLSLRFFATIQPMSVFVMVTGLFALLSVPFMPAEMLQRTPRLLGLDPRWTLALTAALGALVGRLCWLGLRNDPPSNWGE